MKTLLLSMITLMLPLTRSVTINELTVPGVVEEGSENVLLDCNFSYNETEADQLEIKWYFNQDPAPFCQWIAGKEDTKPQLIGNMFKDKVDLSFTAGTNNHTKYRGLLLHKPSTSMSGTYTCKVSTLESEAVAEARMMVYSPAMATEFRQKKVEGSKVNISCTFEGLYPAPTVKLTWGSFELIEDAVLITPREGSYDVIIHKTLEHEELPAETVFGCEVTIPGTEYFLREEAIYHHRGKRSSGDMERIAQLEEIRQRKSKFLYNTDSRLNMDIINDIAYGSSATLSLASMVFLINAALVMMF